jgi:hypothetical protein
VRALSDGCSPLRRRRLVGDDQARLHGQRHGDHHALALAAGELVRVRIAQRGRGGLAHVLQQAEHAPLDQGTAERRVVELQHLGDLVAHPHQRVERGHRLPEDHR